MALDPEQHMVVIKMASTWKAQALAAMDVLDAAAAGQGWTLDGAAEIDYPAFCQLIEALYALSPLTGRPPAQVLMDAAGMVPVDVAVARG